MTLIFTGTRMLFDIALYCDFISSVLLWTGSGFPKQAQEISVFIYLNHSPSVYVCMTRMYIFLTGLLTIQRRSAPCNTDQIHLVK